MRCFQIFGNVYVIEQETKIALKFTKQCNYYQRKVKAQDNSFIHFIHLYIGSLNVQIHFFQVVFDYQIFCKIGILCPIL